MKKQYGLLAAALVSLALLGACGTNKQANAQTMTPATEQVVEQTKEIATELAVEPAKESTELAVEPAKESTTKSAAETAAASAARTGAEKKTESTANSNNTKTADNGEYITEDAAKQTALTHAGLKESDVTFVKVKLDRDDGRMEYEIEFYQGKNEYDYEIDAVSGEIIAVDYDAEQYNGSNAASSGDVIGEEKAKQIALERAGLSEDKVSGLYVEFDVDDGVSEYEVQFNVGRTEYEVTINAETGDIIGFEQDND